MNHEHEQRHASSTAATVAHNDTIEPGQSSRSALLRKPDHAVASGLVQRKARDANGVADGADHAVSAASSSSGSPLPDVLMRKFESSLGADLSDVRIHTGAASERAADAVGAKAYTMGNDIHFGAGHYDPSSSGGQHLLAHEIAHTVQQSGGVQRMQLKLKVSSPGDSLEHEADRAADARIVGETAALSSALGLSRHALQRKPADAGETGGGPAAPKSRPWLKGSIINNSNKALWVVETDTKRAIMHKLQPGFKSPEDVDADGFRAVDGTSVNGHTSWVKVRTLFSANVTNSPDGTLDRGCSWPFCSNVQDDEFGTITTDNGEWGTSMPKDNDEWGKGKAEGLPGGVPLQPFEVNNIGTDPPRPMECGGFTRGSGR